MKEIYTYNEVQELIDRGEAKIIKKNERKNKFEVYRCLIEYGGIQFLLCNDCNNFKMLTYFSDKKESKKLLANKSVNCKLCCSVSMVSLYNKNFISHLRYRYKSIESLSKKNEVPCLSFDEFVEFAKTVKEPFYQLTLEEAFNKNMGGYFEVDHKFPLSKGGTSLQDNLTLIIRPLNRLKGTMNLDETIKLAKLIVANESNLREIYKE